MHVVYFGEGRDGSPHDGIIKKKKKHEKVFINVKCKCDFLGSTKITWKNLLFWIMPKT